MKSLVLCPLDDNGDNDLNIITMTVVMWIAPAVLVIGIFF